MIDLTTIDAKWYQIIASFFSGGVAGAFIKQYFDNKRNRTQPIAYDIELQSVYDSSENKLFDSQIILASESKEYKFSKLYSGTVILHNVGLQDYSEFTFGVTCDEDVKFVQVRPIASDRHHVFKFSKEPTLENQINLFDVSLNPFNRKDSYRFDFLITTGINNIDVPDIKISTSHPVNMVLIKSGIDARELLESIAINTLPFPMRGVTKVVVSLVKVIERRIRL